MTAVPAMKMWARKRDVEERQQRRQQHRRRDRRRATPSVEAAGEVGGDDGGERGDDHEAVERDVEHAGLIGEQAAHAPQRPAASRCGWRS